MCWSATRAGSDWSYRISSTFIATGPHHSEGKNALLTVSKNGTLRLLYQKDSAWAEVSTDIDEPAPFADATLTHAAFGAQQGEFGLAVSGCSLTDTDQTLFILLLMTRAKA